MEFNGLQITIARGVYEPAEDSFLLARHALRCQGRVLEIGCGTGIVALANACAHPNNTVIGVDIHPRAVACARKNARQNSIANVPFIQSDLWERVHGTWDAILFNPPYLPGAVRGRGISCAWNGGKKGRAVLDRFLRGASSRLAPNGTLLFIQSSVNGWEETQRWAEKSGWKTKILGEERFFFEQIYAVAARRTF